MGNAFLLIVVGLLLFYIVVSDKWKCVEGFAGCVTGAGGTQPNTPTLPALPKVPDVLQHKPISYGYPDLSANINWPYGI